MEKMEHAQRGAISALEQDIYQHAYRYEFHQLVSLLELFGREKISALGESSDPDCEAVRIKSYVSMAMPSGEVKSLTASSSNLPHVMEVSFWGIAGIQGPLPQPLTDRVIDRMRDQDYGLRDFLDIFNHRILSLLHRIRKRSLPCLNITEPEDTLKGKSLSALIGANSIASCAHNDIASKTILPYTQMLWQKTKSAVGLKLILQNFLKTPVTIKQFIGQWWPISADQSTVIGGAAGIFNVLGGGESLGTRVWMEDYGVEITLGPMSGELFGACTDKGTLYPKIKAMLEMYLPETLSYSVNAKIAVGGLKALQLGKPLQLGLTTVFMHKSSLLNDGFILIPIFRNDKKSDFSA